MFFLLNMQSYENKETGEVVDVNTNAIEGAWKHCKDHFKVYLLYILKQPRGQYIMISNFKNMVTID